MWWVFVRDKSRVSIWCFFFAWKIENQNIHFICSNCRYLVLRFALLSLSPLFGGMNECSGRFDHRMLFDVSSFRLLFHRSITCEMCAGGLVFAVILNKVIYLFRCAPCVGVRSNRINRCKAFQWNKMWLLYLFCFISLSTVSVFISVVYPVSEKYRIEYNGCNEIVSNCLECIAHLYKWKWICNKIAHTNPRRQTLNHLGRTNNSLLKS